MGNMQATEMRDLLSFEQALEWHLQYNHYPPLSLDLMEPAKQAIKNARAGDYEAMVKMPEGRGYAEEVATRELVEAFYLHPWLEGGECEEVTT